MSASGTARIVKEYIKRVESHDLEEYPQWDVRIPLPKLPVPSLNHTLEMYRKVLKPITSDEEYDKADQLIHQFLTSGGEGETLQRKLIELAETTDNWAYKWWLDDMYLLNSSALPINSNPGMVFPKTTFSDKNEQLRFAARLVSGILDYKVIIDAKALPIDRCRHREKGQPLCMAQYYRLFSSYREPGVDKDKLRTVEGEPGREHITVIRNNQIFKMDVVNNVMRLSEDDICCQLKRICRMADQSAHNADESVGILTAQTRDQWARCRQLLLQDTVNAESLKSIETSIFILCLDKTIPVKFNHRRSIDETEHNSRDDNSVALQMLHGQGTIQNSCNRWYDKTMQFIIGEDGACGLNYEHSASEGIAVVQLIEHVLKYMEELRKRKLVRMNSIVDLPYPEALRWQIRDETKSSVLSATVHMDEAISNLDFYLLRFSKYGKEFPKSQNMSPDCLIQLALQLTFYKIHNRLVSTYESASTRRYRLGRVDNIRAASCEALAWCKSMTGETTCSAEQKMTLLREAMQAQTDYMVQTILGHGMDCHLLALKCIAEQNGGGTPELFKHITWSLCNQFVLSTSQVNTTLDSFMGYGPVVPNGYGTSYNPQSDKIVFCISSFKNCADTRSDRFAITLSRVLTEIHELCLEVNSRSKLKTIKENGDSTHNKTINNTNNDTNDSIHSNNNNNHISGDSHIKLSLNGDISLNPEHPVAHKEPGLPVRKSSSPRRLVRQKVTHFNGIEPMGNSEC